MPSAPYPELSPSPRFLLGPGPSNVHPRVLRALSKPPLGYLDPEFIAILDEIVAMLRAVYDLEQGLTLPLSGTGGSGMEAALTNLLEPGGTAVICVNGFFGGRLVEIAARQGADVSTVEAEWGRTIDPDQLRQELGRHLKVKLVAVVHAETSTGALQPLEELAQLVHEHEALFVVDAVTSLGGSELSIERLSIDFAYSATQKCLGGPPGLSPVAISERALKVIADREKPPAGWYLDVQLLRQYWEGSARIYHHTPPVPLLYALHEALRLILEEGLEARFDRHLRNGRALRAGLEALGLRLLVPDAQCTPQLTSVLVPEGLDEAGLRAALRKEHNIEIGGGLGQLRGRLWRIGLMGESSSAGNVLVLLAALEELLPRFGFEVATGAGVSAASRALAQA
jgi:alanine-glyoxylate transaminase/serine-glyoxylate transaminase/serine-pyruvate transaminase